MKTERLLAITMILLNKKQISATQLAEIFEVSIRTIYRDINSLSEAGIPVLALPGVNGGIQIMDTYKVDKHFFTTSEITALLIALENLGKNIATRHSNQTIEKLKTLVPNHLSNEIELKINQVMVDLTPWTNNQTLQPFLEIVKSAMDYQHLLQFDYRDNRGNQTTRTVEPYRLVLKEISWYVQAYCLEKNEFRTFKLSRMSSLNELNKSFKPRKFHATALGKEPFYGKKFTSVTLKVSHKIKDQLTEKFGDLAILRTTDSNEVLVEFPFMEDDFSYNLLIGLGNQCECIAPNHVRTELKKRIAELLEKYTE